MKTTDPTELAKWLRETCGETLARFFPGREPVIADELAARWTERHRSWHGPDHLREMLSAIAQEDRGDEAALLQLTALFHDAIYDTTSGENEIASARLLQARAATPSDALVRRACELIVESKWESLSENRVSRRFFDLDTRQLADGASIGERLKYERRIFREYQQVSLQVFREKRAEFLRGWAVRFPHHSTGVGECLELVADTEPRIGIYPGSFDPFHRGHLSILRQAEEVFDKVIVAVGINRQKMRSAGSDAVAAMESRTKQLSTQLRFHEVTAFGGLLTDYLTDLGHPATLVRGVRDGTDLEAELRLSRFLNELRPNSNIVWISCEAELQHLSSSAIRELESLEPGAGVRYIPSAGQIYDLVDADGA